LFLEFIFIRQLHIPDLTFNACDGLLSLQPELFCIGLGPGQFFPGLLAVIVTVMVTTLIKLGFRAAKQEPLNFFLQVGAALGVGAVIGPVMQLLFQRLMYWLFGLPKLWELVVLAAGLTGLVSIAAYHAMLWYLDHKGYKSAYALLRVKHDPKKGHVGESEDGDITRSKPPDRPDGAPPDYSD